MTPPPPPILSEIISLDLDKSQESIFGCKKFVGHGFLPFGGTVASLYNRQGSRNPLARSPRRVQTMSGLVQSQEVLVRWATNLF